MQLSYRKYFVKVWVAVAIPVLIAVGIRNFIIGHYLAGLIFLGMTVIHVGLFSYMRRSQFQSRENRVYEYFLFAQFILFGILLVYKIGFEGNLSRMPWAYLFVVAAFFSLGGFRGLLWAITLLIALLSADFLLAPTNK